MPVKNNIIRLNLYNKKFRVGAHICVWLVLMALPYIMHSINVLPSRTFTGKELSSFIKLDYVGYVYWMAAFYFNSFILIPNLFMKGKYPYYALAVLSVYAIFLFIYHHIYNWLQIDLPYGLLRTIWLRLPAFLLTMAASLAYTTINGLLDYQAKLRDTEKEKLKTELSFLRSQISPHFIFNVLNNIVSLGRLKSTELEPTIMKLSGLMKYMLYHTDDEKVNIKIEEEYLNHYIDLQRQRFGKKIRVETSFTILNENQLIEPMLLIPFIENAFKHGVVSINDPSIIIELVTDERFLNFNVINKYNALNAGQKDDSSGIGIANVSRRINLLYENKHQLSIKTDNDYFEVNLILKLDA
jgi:two-component system LytT family sensor kinase